MTPVRTLVELEDALQLDASWRRKELASLYLSAIGGKGEAQSRAIRSGIALTYAHLEGFVRQSVRVYLAFVRGRNLRYEELAHCFLSLKVSRMVSQGTTKASYYHGAVRMLIEDAKEIAILPEPEVISAHSNLSFSRFVEILYCVNLDASRFSLREHFFDDVILARRNAIVHGEFRKPVLSDYIEIHNGVLDITDRLEQMIVDAASNAKYKR